MTVPQPHETTSGYLAALASHIHIDPTPSAARAHVVRAAAEARGMRARWRRHIARLTLLAVTMATLIGTSGVAAAGHLPPTMQRIVADAASLMPVPVPIPYPEPSSSDTGMEPVPVLIAEEYATEGGRVEPEQTPPPETNGPAEVTVGHERATDSDEARPLAEKKHQTDWWKDDDGRRDPEDLRERGDEQREGRRELEDRDRTGQDEWSDRDNGDDQGNARGESGDRRKGDNDDDRGSESDGDRDDDHENGDGHRDERDESQQDSHGDDRD